MDRLAYIPLAVISVLSLLLMSAKWKRAPECLHLNIKIDADSIGYDGDTIRLIQKQNINFYTDIVDEKAKYTWKLAEGVEKSGDNIYYHFREKGVYDVVLTSSKGKLPCVEDKRTIKIVGLSIKKRVEPKIEMEKPSMPRPDILLKLSQNDNVVSHVGRKLLIDKEIVFEAFSGKITNWKWDFGDGTVSNSRKQPHRFQEEGVYNVTLSLDSNISWDTTFVVEVSNDADGDGISNFADQCPYQKGRRNAQGCPDRDGDGVPDYRDKCPDEPGLRRSPLWGCPDPKLKSVTAQKSPDISENTGVSNKSIEINPYDDPELPLLNYVSSDKPFGLDKPCESYKDREMKRLAFDVIITPKKNIRIDHAYLYSYDLKQVKIQLLTEDDIELESRTILLISDKTRLSFKREDFYCKKGLTYKLRVIPYGTGDIQFSKIKNCSYVASPFVDVKYKNGEVGLFKIDYDYEKD